MKHCFSIAPCIPFEIFCPWVLPRICLTAIAMILLAVSVAGADEVKLVGGDVLRGTVVEQTDTQVILEHSALGLVQIPREKITSVVVGESTSQEGGGAAPAEKTEKERPEKRDRDVDWKSHVELAFNSSAGNTDTQSLRIGGRSRRRTPHTRLNLSTAYYLSASDGVRDNNRFTLGATQDWFIAESRWFYFAEGRYDYDEFESWEQRIAAHGGPGYNLIEMDNFDMDLRAGIGPRREFGSEDAAWKPEGLVGFDIEWKITKRQSVDLNSRFYPIVNDIRDYRTRTTAHWKLKVAPESDLSVTAGVVHEYQSVVDPGLDKNDIRIFTGVQYDF